MMVLPVAIDHVVARLLDLVRRRGKGRHQFQGRVTAVKRRDQRLQNRGRAVVAAGVAPSLQADALR